MSDPEERLETYGDLGENFADLDPIGELAMKTLNILAAAALAASVLATSASAQEPMMMMKDNQAMMTMPNGEMSSMMMMDDSMMTMALENATPVEDGTIFFMNDGRLYMEKDMKMENGEMMSEGMMSQ